MLTKNDTHFVFFVISLGLLLSGSTISTAGTSSPLLNVTTNRFVILDDPSGWVSGWSGNTGVGNQWSGESTTLRWYALLMNSSGRAAKGITVTSTLVFPNGSIAGTKTNVTNSYGIAEFNQNMDNWLQTYGSGSEGTYAISASATVDNLPVAGKYNFVYDEWGCGSGGSGCHRSQYWQGSGVGPQLANRWASGSIQNSPYLHAWDNYHSSSGHGGKGGIGTGECLTCHRSYDGINRLHTARVTATPQYSAGIHYGKAGAACTDCHTTFGSGTMPIKQCYDCHPKKNNNLTVESFSQTATSGFSYQPLTASNIQAHNGKISCILCHKGMHNVSRPYSGPGTSNTFTEYQQCTSCHNAYQRHNSSVSCTVCHSQDAHVIKVFAQNATYISSIASSYRGNCTNCHQNSFFLGTLISQPKAGSYTGNAPQIPAILGHSSDKSGQKWGNYWVAPSGACLYCHGSTQHNTSAMGKAGGALGSDKVGDPIATGTVCSSCHYQADSNYGVVNSLNPKPPANRPGANYPLIGAVDHSSYGITDADCKNCHGGNLAGSDTMSEFLHNVAPGSGGGSCTSCHSQPPDGVSRYNTQGAHTLHALAGYGNIAITGCNYCHATGGTNEPGHPGTFNDATVATNASATITTYTQKTASGSDDTCSGVSCHSRGLSPAAIAGTAVWNSATAGACNVCHSTSPTGLPATGNHSKHYITKGYSCATCHGFNADSGKQTGHKKNALIDISFTNLSSGGSIASGTCTVYCHSPNPNDPKPKPKWGVSKVACGDCHSIPPTTTRNGKTPHAGVTDCEGCHGAGANTGTHTGHINGIINGGGGTSCVDCHSTVATSLGLHSLLNGTADADDGDCKTCHFGSFRMAAGAANYNNTYFCQDCHTSGGRNPAQYNNINITNATLIKNAMPPGHAQNRCEQCHIAGDDEQRPLPAEYKYHSGGPKGTAAGKNCYSCHFRSDGARFGAATAGLNDKPFNAPGEAHGCAAGCHSVAPGQERPSLTDCQNCHGAGSPDITHEVNIGGHTGSEVTSIGSVSITSPVNAGDTATVSAIVDSVFTQIARAQYMIKDSTNTIIIKDWTEMDAVDGKFDKSSEPVVGYIDTTGLSGNYTVLVRGMSSAAYGAPPGGINHDTSEPYYPNNGVWTDASAVGMEVKGIAVLVAGQIYGGPLSWRTNFRVGNYGTNDTNASIKFYNPSGTQINLTNTTIPRYASANYEWKDYASGVSDGTALIISKEPVSVITFQRMDTDGKLGFWEGVPLNSQSTEVFVSGLLYNPGGWRTGFRVLNMEDTYASVTMYFYNSAGTLINTITRSIVPESSPYFDWYTYGYNITGGSTDGTVKAVSDRRIHIITSQVADSTGKLGFWDGIPLNSQSTEVLVSGLLYSPGGWRSGFKVANYNDLSARVTIYFYNASGMVANTVTRTIAPRTSPYFDWYTYGYNLSGGSTDGTAVVVSDKPVKIVASQAMETQGIVDFYQAVQISGNNTAYAAYQVYDGIERSGIKVANPGTAAISAAIKFYDQSGHLVNITTGKIAPKTSPYYAWNSYAPGITTGSVVIEATGRIVAIASIAGEQPGKLGIFRGIGV